jgi:methionyl-tRNA formyltransferase
LRIVFAGTGAFGIPTLRHLHRSGFEIALVISQPDRPAGRRKALTPPPLAEEAAALGLPLFQPEKLNRPEARGRLAELEPAALVVVSYGQILGSKVLAIPAHGCFNLHGSLLPRHRGASPIQAAILAGDAHSGVTAMLMDSGLDTGPILLQEAVPLRPRETAGELHDRLAALGAPLMERALRGHASGEVVPRAQDSARVTTCGLISKEDGRLDWSRSAVALERRIRAMCPWPGAFTTAPGARGPLRLLIEEAALEEGPATAEPGEVLEASARALIVAAGEGALRLIRVKPAGRRALDAAAFLRGHRLVPGDRLGLD